MDNFLLICLHDQILVRLLWALLTKLWQWLAFSKNSVESSLGKNYPPLIHDQFPHPPPLMSLSFTFPCCIWNWAQFYYIRSLFSYYNSSWIKCILTAFTAIRLCFSWTQGILTVECLALSSTNFRDYLSPCAPLTGFYWLF